MTTTTNILPFPLRTPTSPAPAVVHHASQSPTAHQPPVVRRPGMKPLGASLADTLRPYCGAGQRVIWRNEQHWTSDDGTWAARFDGCTLDELTYAFSYDIVVNCQLAAIVALKPPPL